MDCDLLNAFEDWLWSTFQVNYLLRNAEINQIGDFVYEIKFVSKYRFIYPSRFLNSSNKYELVNQMRIRTKLEPENYTYILLDLNTWSTLNFSSTDEYSETLTTEGIYEYEFVGYEQKYLTANAIQEINDVIHSVNEEIKGQPIVRKLFKQFEDLYPKNELCIRIAASEAYGFLEGIKIERFHLKQVGSSCYELLATKIRFLINYDPVDVHFRSFNEFAKDMFKKSRLFVKKKRKEYSYFLISPISHLSGYIEYVEKLNDENIINEIYFLRWWLSKNRLSEETLNSIQVFLKSDSRVKLIRIGLFAYQHMNYRFIVSSHIFGQDTLTILNEASLIAPFKFENYQYFVINRFHAIEKIGTESLSNYQTEQLKNGIYNLKLAIR